MPGDEIGKKPLIFSVNIAATVDGTPYLLARDFSVDPTTETVELRISTSEGDLLVDLTDSALIGVRATNGSFSCDETQSDYLYRRWHAGGGTRSRAAAQRNFARGVALAPTVRRCQ